MSRRSALCAVCCLVMLLVVTLPCFGCGEDGEKKRVIVIGHISDMTGAAAPAMVNVNYALEDQVKHINDTGALPGVELKVITYDSRYDPSRAIPAYDWCRSKGAEVIVCGLPPILEVLKAFADRDGFPLFSLPCSESLTDPPGWVFTMNAPTTSTLKTLCQWISENDWDYQTEGRKPRIGSAVWDETYGIDCTRGIEQYAKDHPDEFEYVVGARVPMGTVNWDAEVQKLKGCDYVFIPATGMGTITFVNQYRDKGGKATFLGNDAQPAYRGLVVDSCGWDKVNGMLNSYSVLWWNDPVPVIELANELLSEYHPGMVEDIIHEGGGYIGAFQELYCCLDILQEAVKEVGPEEFDGQAIYNTAVGFKATWEGYAEWSFTETRRYSVDYLTIYEWSAQHQDMVRKIDTWIPLVIE